MGIILQSLITCGNVLSLVFNSFFYPALFLLLSPGCFTNFNKHHQRCLNTFWGDSRADLVMSPVELDSIIFIVLTLFSLSAAGHQLDRAHKLAGHSWRQVSSFRLNFYQLLSRCDAWWRIYSYFDMREQLWNVNLWPSDEFLLMRREVSFGVDKTYGVLARSVPWCCTTVVALTLLNW